MICISMFRTVCCLLFSVSLFVHTHALPTWGGELFNLDYLRCTSKISKPPLCSTPGTCLSGPGWSSSPVAVVLGVGTQNYTCSSPDATPTANGAVADLFDITCLVATNPEAAHYMSALAAKDSCQVTAAGKVPFGLGFPKVGYHHFAPNARTAVFDLRLGNRDWKFVGGRLEGIPAPPDALEGTVDWLKLGRTAGLEKQSKGVKYIYRVHTAGGKPPATCKGIRGEVTVNYATEYWFYD